MPTTLQGRRAKRRKYRRARIRNFLFTVGPDRLSGGRIARRHLSQECIVREIDVVSTNWPEKFDGLRIGHISDFHVGDLHTVDNALKAIEQLAACEVDLIACTGDVVDLHADLAGPVVTALGAVKAQLGSFMVLGNHD